MQTPLHSYPPSTTPLKKSPFIFRRWRALFFVLSIFFAIGAVASWGNRTIEGPTGGTRAGLPIWNSLTSWLQGLHAQPLAKEERLNILILGQGGFGHDGPFLTDTILLLSVKPKSGDAVLLSIPRDLAVPIPELGLRKINEVNAIGEVRESGSGAAFTADVVGRTLQLPIAAYVRIDFRGFEKIIDALGGIEIIVERPFTDNLYPDDQGGTTAISFAAGTQTMDGATALAYVRSRHGNNGEGSDFARAKRQQQLLLAIREKLFRLSTLMKPGRVAAIVNTLNTHISTNIPINQIDDLLAIARRTESSPLTRHVLDSSPEGILKDAIDASGAYILLPKDGSYESLSQYVGNLLASEELRAETVSVAVLNGTAESGLARKTAGELASLGIGVTVSANAPSRNWHESVIFDISHGIYPKTLAMLQEKYHARILNNSAPEEILEAAARGSWYGQEQPRRAIDIILILGK